MKKEVIWVTGGAGFIGAHFILQLRQQHPQFEIWNIDALRYAADLRRLRQMEYAPDYRFVHADVGDEQKMEDLFKQVQGRLKCIVHFAAQTHVDRAIDDAQPFIQDNVVALDRFLKVWSAQSTQYPGLKNVHFLYVSTDEVYGALTLEEPSCRETRPVSPSNPYAVSKSNAEEVVRKYARTHGLSYLITRSSNNMGVGQHIEKLVPKMLHSALSHQSMTVYGQGLQVRDWIDVRDHAQALIFLLFCNIREDVYNIGSEQTCANIDLVKRLCICLDQLKPHVNGSYQRLIQYVADRPGHDMRYALNVDKIHRLGWKSMYSLEQSIDWVVRGTLDNYS